MPSVVEDAPRQVVADALAVAGRVQVERRDGDRVRDHRVRDPVADLLPPEVDVVELLLGRDPDGAAGERRHEVRELAAHDGDDRGGLGLHLEGLEVVRDGDEVQFRRQLHRRVTPVAVGEDRELAALDEALEALLDGAEVRRRRAGGLGEGVGVGDVGGQRGDRRRRSRAPSACRTTGCGCAAPQRPR